MEVIVEGVSVVEDGELGSGPESWRTRLETSRIKMFAFGAEVSYSSTMLKHLGFFSILFSFLTAGCEVFVSQRYKQASLSVWDGWNGYRDKQIAPGVYVLEVTQIGGYNHDMRVLKKNWFRRAAELCPQGYTGEPEVIRPYEAKLDELRTAKNYAQLYPMVSGVIHAK